MRKINYRSDFDFILHLKDCKDPEKAVPFPECGFDIRFWASNKANAYIASYKDGAYTNCFRTEDGGMHFVFDNHRLGVGTLKWEPHFELPNDIYPDNIQDLFSKESLDIELVDGPGDCPTTAEVEVIVPYIKGEKGDKGDKMTFEDLTAQDKAELIAPIREDIEKALANKRLFCDLFNAAAGTNGYARFEDGVFDCELNKLKLTYEEAVDVYVRGMTEYPAPKPMTETVRTNLFIGTPIYRGLSQTTLANLCAYATSLETVRVSADGSFVMCNDLTNTFWGCRSLREVLGVIDVYNVTSLRQTFSNCPVLETVRLRRVRVSADMSATGAVSLESMQYLVRNAANTGSIVITVHPDVYTRLADEDNAEWRQVLLEAAEKQIIFATA